MGLFRKKKLTELDPWVVHLKGLPNTKIKNCRIKCDDNYLIIATMIGGILKPKNVDTVFKISIDKVISLDLVSKNNIALKNKAILNKGIGGVMLFNAAEDFLNGKGEIALLHDTKPKRVLNLVYHGDDEDDIKVIVFNADHEVGSTIEFESEFNKRYLKETVVTNEEGEILL